MVQQKNAEDLFTCKSPQFTQCTNKKENTIFLIYKKIQNGGVAKSYMEGLPNI